MTVTFIAHSAYLVEWDKFYTLFDYTYEPDYTGALPELNPEKPLLVFASHSHEDHFDAKVFTLLEKYPDTRFFVSRDTRLTERKRQWLNISDEAFARTTILRPDSILLTDVGGEDLSSAPSSRRTSAMPIFCALRGRWSTTGAISTGGTGRARARLTATT